MELVSSRKSFQQKISKKLNFVGGISFIHKELSKNSYPQISDLKNYPEELSNENIIQINAILYQRNDATPLYTTTGASL